MVNIKLTHPDAVVPEYQTKGAAGFDLAIVEDVELTFGVPKFADTGLAIETPRDHFLMIVERSSTFKKWGISLGNTIGVVDSDYAGNDDKIKLFLHWSKVVVDTDIFALPGEAPKLKIPAGTRLAQGLFIPVVQAEFDVVEDLTQQSRGGFGSTG